MTKICCSSRGCGSREQREKLSWMKGFLETPVGSIPLVKTELDRADQRSGNLVRWGHNRMGYVIEPGLYGVGQPDENAPVLVTANYKLTFDAVRKELAGVDAWILVLDTKGVNVWCAAGKGTFGTEELVRQIGETGLAQLVAHRQVFLPQLGGPGVAAHEVKKASGFQVIYGPIRATDLPAFLRNQKVEPEMRRVTFTLKERLVLIPIELRGMLRPLLLILLGLGLIHLLAGLSGQLMVDAVAIIGAFLVGAGLVPLFLPWIPVRSFAMKGWILGVMWAGGVSVLFQTNLVGILANLFLLSPISAYLGLNFTGCTPYTSLSGVKKEMRLGVPLMIGSVVIGLVLKIMVIF